MLSLANNKTKYFPNQKEKWELIRKQMAEYRRNIKNNPNTDNFSTVIHVDFKKKEITKKEYIMKRKAA